MASDNGLNWLDQVILNSSLPTRAYNFAQDGACVDSALCLWTPEQIRYNVSFKNQVEAFAESNLARSGHTNTSPQPWTDTKSVFVIWFGTNDVLWTVGAFAANSSVVDGILDSYMLSIRRLCDAGARRFVLIGLPREQTSLIAETMANKTQLLICFRALSLPPSRKGQGRAGRGTSFCDNALHLSVAWNQAW